MSERQPDKRTDKAETPGAAEVPASRRARRLAMLGALGPGLVSALAGTDAGGIATFSSAGAKLGFAMMWSVPFTCVLLIVVQETASRMGCATGKGFASLVREQFGIRISAVAMLATVITNCSVMLSEFAGIAQGAALFDIPSYLCVPVAAVTVWLITMSGSYGRVEKILLLISCVFFAYVVAGVLSDPDWAAAGIATVVPHLSADPSYISLLVANIGTTISPYMIYMVSSSVVEKNLDASDIPGQRLDNVLGCILSQAVSWFILLTTATVLFPQGIEVTTAADAALALVPFAGSYAMALFAVGLIGASLLAACALPSITASAVCEAFGWERGADRTWREAPVYRGIITFITFFSAAICLIPNIDLFGVTMLAQIVNGVILPVLLVCMVKIAGDRHVMGDYANGAVYTALTWVTIALVVVLTVMMVVFSLMGV